MDWQAFSFYRKENRPLEYMIWCLFYNKTAYLFLSGCLSMQMYIKPVSFSSYLKETCLLTLWLFFLGLFAELICYLHHCVGRQ